MPVKPSILSRPIERETEARLSPGFVRELEALVTKAWDGGGQGDDGLNDIWTPELKAFLDAQTLKGLFISDDWVFILVDLVASKISSQLLRVMEKIPDGKNMVVEPVADHPLTALFAQPNEWQDYAQWMYNSVVELFLGGNAIMWNAPKSGQLITFPFETITLQFNDRQRLSSYTSNVYDQASGQLVPQMGFKPESIIHVRRPNPSSLLWGLSPFIPGRKSVLFNRYSSDYLNAFYQKQATPGLALSLDRTVNEDVALRQLRSFEVAYQGRKNMRRTLILPKGVEAKPLTHSLADQKLIDHVKQNRETIFGLLKVPKHELSLAEAGSLGSEEHKVALRNFWEATLLPGMKLIAGALTKFFQAELGENRFIEFDVRSVEALKDDLKKKADTAAAMLQSGLSINEVRQQVWEKEIIDDPDADKPYVLVSKGATVSVTPPPTQNAAVPEAVKTIAPKKKIASTPAIESFRARVFKQLVDEESRTITDLAKTAVNLLVGMTETAIDALLEMDKQALALRVKALPPKRAMERRLQKVFTEKFEEEWQTEVARTLSKSVELGYDQQLQLVLNEKDRTSIEVLRLRDAAGRLAMLNARGLDSFAGISATHTERIVRQVEEGMRNGEAIGKIMKRVADALGTPDKIIGRAETIARTETLTAVSIGQAAAVENAKEVIPGLQKAWLTASDDRVRDSHAELDGDVVGVDETFGNGLRHPRDVNSSDPAEVINCFPGSTRVSALDTRRVFQRFYRGPMVTVKFKSGAKLTATPKHPVLTSKGWVGIGALAKGDQVFKACGFDPLSARDKNVNHIETSFSQAFRSSLETGYSVRRAGTRGDFHGDGSTANVEIVNSEGLLKNGGKSSGHKAGVDFSLATSNFAHGACFGERGELESARGIGGTHSGVGSGNLLAAFRESFSAPFEKFGGALPAQGNTSGEQAFSDSAPSNAKMPAELKNGELLLGVELDEIVDVYVQPFAGHVYNLEVNGGWYLADQFVAHNCRCTLLMLPPGEEVNQ